MHFYNVFLSSKGFRLCFLRHDVDQYGGVAVVRKLDGINDRALIYFLLHGRVFMDGCAGS